MTPRTPGQRLADEVEDTITAAVDGLCACGCKQPLPADGPSAYFLGEGHQRAWAMRNANKPSEVTDPVGAIWTIPADAAPGIYEVAFANVERSFDEVLTAMGPPVWRQMSEGEIQSTYDTMRRIETGLCGIPVVASPLVPEGQIIVASDGTRSGLSTPVAMVRDLVSLFPKPAPRRPWWRRLLWWRNR